MRHGDISNKPTPTILVRMDNTIFQDVVKEGVINKLRSKVGLKPTTFLDLKPNAISFLSHIAHRTDYNISLIFIEGEDTKLVEKERILQDTILDLNVVTISRSALEVLVGYMECTLVDNKCHRDKVYSLEEAIYLYR